MGRPRKDRTQEYAGLLAEEITFHIGKALTKTVEDNLQSYRQEIVALSAEVTALRKQVDDLSRRVRPTKAKPRLGRWVPGGPGRPPKDAAARIAAFAARADAGAEDEHEALEKTAKPKKRRKGRKS